MNEERKITKKYVTQVVQGRGGGGGRKMMKGQPENK
jgi:hypothetical protein